MNFKFSKTRVIHLIMTLRSVKISKNVPNARKLFQRVFMSLEMIKIFAMIQEIGSVMKIWLMKESKFLTRQRINLI